MKKRVWSILLVAAMLASTVTMAAFNVSAETAPQADDTPVAEVETDYNNFFKEVEVTNVENATEADGVWTLTADQTATFKTTPIFGSGFSFLVDAPEGTNLTVTLRDTNNYLTYKETLAAEGVQRVAFDFSEAVAKNTIYQRMNKVTTVMEITADADVDVCDLSSFSLGALVLPEEEEEYKRGDADLDGVVTPLDALLTLRVSVGLEEFTDVQMKVANLDNPEIDEITPLDALVILRISVGLE